MLLRKLPYSFIPVILLLCAMLSSAQPNPCGVRAVLSPNVTDSVLTSPSAIYFQSASINATSYKIIIDYFQFSSSVNWGIAPGLTTVKLVAYNGNCTDTAVAYFFTPVIILQNGG